MAVNSNVFVDRCPSCRTSLKIDPTVAGAYSRCPSCGAMLRVVAPGKRAKQKSVRSSEESLGVLAFWICGVGAALTVFSIAGVIAVGMRNNNSAATSPPPTAMVGVMPAPKPSPLMPTADANDAAISQPPVTVSPSVKPDEQLVRSRTPDIPERTPAESPHKLPKATTPPKPPSTQSPPSEAREYVPPNVVAKVIGVRADVFLIREESGRVPTLGRAAPIDHHYIFITLDLRNVSPDPTRLYLDPRGADDVVMLKNADGEIAQCIGRCRPELAPPRQLDDRPIVLAGRQHLTGVTIVFVVPSSWDTATLYGPGFQSDRMPLPTPDVETVSLRDLTGWWVRCPHQPVRMKYENPIMELLTRQGVERMLITREESPGRSVLSIPFVDVAGVLSWPEGTNRAKEASFDLRKGSARLYGRVRMAGRRDVLVFYASNDPFDQLIYVHQPH